MSSSIEGDGGHASKEGDSLSGGGLVGVIGWGEGRVYRF